MSRHVLEFGGEHLEWELADESLVDAFKAPEGLTGGEAEAALRDALERPSGYPPLRQVVVPGDRVVVALGPELADPGPLLEIVADVLQGAGVEADGIQVVEPEGRVGAFEAGPRLGAREVHDPATREKLAYLATTEKGSRVYLNRTLTDADVALPVGLIRQDPLTGVLGPWSVVYPGLSDEATREAHRRSHRDVPPGRSPRFAADEEAIEVGTLLGAHFQVGVVPGSRGPAEFLAGRVDAVRDAGMAALGRTWTFRPEARAELVVAGIGGEGPTGMHELVAGLTTAGRLVRRGGRIVALSRAAGPLGPSLQRLAAAGDADAREVLQGREADPDHLLGKMLAHVLAWADVYLLSGLDADLVEDLSMIPLERPEEAARLVARSDSCLLVDRAERVRVETADRDDA